jgi:hypothetical protein
MQPIFQPKMAQKKPACTLGGGQSLRGCAFAANNAWCYILFYKTAAVPA